ncbi:MAG: hypothetical protein JWO85_991, partial [Candidatus Eremiobacteraeota bacterium]|nr:hypothetical protein [Candidatus Eremiobacteraeota bacterium]
MIGGDIDRAAPCAFDLGAREAGQQTAQAGFCTRCSGGIVREARVHAAAEADRPAAAPHDDAAVVGRAEVMEEHPSVDDRLAAGPADLGEEVRHRLRQHDVRAEVRHVAAHRPPPTRGRVRRHDDRLRAAQILDAPHGRSLVHGDSCVDGLAPEHAHEPRRLHGRALGEEHAAAEDRGLDALCELVRAERHRLLRRADGGGRLHRVVEGAILRRRRRHAQHSALMQPDVGAERADGEDDSFSGARDGKRASLAEHGPRAADARPVAVQEAAVSAARARAAAFRLEQD